MVSLLAAMEFSQTGRWTVEQAVAWQEKQHWRAGCNFSPSTAINQLEMWQAETFDPATLDRELGWMKSVGMSLARVYLHDLAYEVDPAGFKERLGTFLSLASKHGVKVMFVIFDDCWNPEPRLGRQPQPAKGVHNSGWVQSPAVSQRVWPRDEPRLKTYVKDVLSTFKADPRVFMWDLYNEPSNSGHGDASAHLLKRVFEWAWEVRPDQPLTAGAWLGGGGLDRLSLDLSDVTSFHHYGPPEDLRKAIDVYKAEKRPIVCSEWMARTAGSLISTNLPILKENGISCTQWGFVSGKTNTIFPWGSKEGSEEPKVWFHDLLRANGEPFDRAEVELYRTLTRAKVD